MDHSGSSGILIMLVSIVVPEKVPGQKSVTKKKQKKKKKKKLNFWAFLTSFYSNPDMTISNFFDVYVFILCISTLILIFDPFCLSLFLKGSPKSSPNRYT